MRFLDGILKLFCIGQNVWLGSKDREGVGGGGERNTVDGTQSSLAFVPLFLRFYVCVCVYLSACLD